MQLAQTNPSESSKLGLLLTHSPQPMDSVPCHLTSCNGQSHQMPSPQSVMNCPPSHPTHATSYPSSTLATPLSPAPTAPSIDNHAIKNHGAQWPHLSLQQSMEQFHMDITKVLDDHQRLIQHMFDQLLHCLQQTLSSVHMRGTVLQQEYPSPLNCQFLCPSGDFNMEAAGELWFKSLFYSLLPFLLCSPQSWKPSKAPTMDQTTVLTQSHFSHDPLHSLWQHRIC